MKNIGLLKRLYRSAPLCGLLVFVFLLSACVTDLNVMKADINDLKEDSYQTKKDIEDIKRILSSLQNDVADLKTKAEKGNGESLAAVRKNQANLFLQVSELLREVQVLSGRFDENKYFTDKLLKETSSEIEVIKSRLDSISAAGSRAQLEAIRTRIENIDSELSRLKERLSALEEITREAETQKEITPEKIYEAARNTFKEKRYEEARQQFEAFIKTFPNHYLAGNAQFWIAETYYAQKDYDDAILAYEELLQNYKKSLKVPGAMLKQAFAFLELGDKKAARGILRELIEKYPDSEQAKAAKEKLEKISGSKD
jgi:tol-pal system protein YbgF